MTQPTPQTDWQSRFWNEHTTQCRIERTPQDIDTRIMSTTPNKMLAFISNERKQLLKEVKELVKKYDESPDDMAGFEIRIKRPTLFLAELERLEAK